jgi:hypothetical protein
MHKLINSETSAVQSFRIIGGKVIKVTVVKKSAEVFCQDEFSAEIAAKALTNGGITAPHISIGFSEANESELLAVKSASPDRAQEIDRLIKFLKEGEQPPPPIRVEITNANQLQKDTVLRIHRDESGKLASATAHKI